MTSRAFRLPGLCTATSAAAFALLPTFALALADDRPKVAYLGSEGLNLDSDVQKLFDEAVLEGLRDTQSVQPVAVERPPRTADDRPCVSQVCAAAAAQSGAQIFFKAEIAETMTQGSPSYQIKLVAVQASPYDVVAIHDFEVRNSIPEHLAVQADAQVTVLLKKIVTFVEAEKARAAEAPALTAASSGGAADAPSGREGRWPWLLLAGTGVAAAGLGGHLLFVDGKPVCSSLPATECGRVYETNRRGLIATGVGVAVLAAGLWGFIRPSAERPSRRTEVGIGPGTIAVKGGF
jgi:hypothetical protein